MNDFYITKDLGETAVLLTKNFKLTTINWKDGIAYFSFTPRDEAQGIAHQYNFGGVEVSAKAFYENLITVKRKIFVKNNTQQKRR